MRVLYRFAKKERLRFVSHLDLQRFMQRALNRTGLKIAYSNGFNPHPILSFPSALAIGWTSEYELFDVKLAEPIDRDTALAEMRQALPPDLPILDARLVDDRHPALMGRLVMADYDLGLADGVKALHEAADVYWAQETVLAMRKTKSGEKQTNIRPMSIFLEKKPSGFYARLMLTEQETLKPDLLLRTLAEIAGIELPPVRIHRLLLLGQDARGTAKPLLDL